MHRGIHAWRGATSILGDAIDLGQAGNARGRLLQCRLPQIIHADLLRRFGNLQRVAARQHDRGDLIGQRQHLVEAGAALVALGALGAADRLVQLDARIQLRLGEALGQQRMLGQRGQALAVATQAARQALGDHQRHRAGDVVRRDAHVHQARDGLRRIVGRGFRRP
ncbi:hypothetical protein G6F31_019630 [Rhizopus arrhizus]|nr:hypothetical protein G6F31_019630 [Rhizopus arrhizus]